MKPFRKIPTYTELRKWTIKHFEKNLLHIIHQTIWYLPLDDYPRIYTNYENEQKMANLIIEYYNWLIKEFSIRGIVSLKETDEKIDTLILKYEKEY